MRLLSPSIITYDRIWYDRCRCETFGFEKIEGSVDSDPAFNTIEAAPFFERSFYSVAMDALLFLFAAAALVALADRWPPSMLAAVPFAALVGTTLPDLDTALGLGHRSALTHGMLPVLVALWSPRWRPVAAGLALGIGLHLSADVFPNGMRGFATVKLPGIGSIGRGWSWAWLGVNAVAALATGASLLRRMASAGATLAILIVVAVIGVGYLFVTDGGWPALLVYGGTGWVLVRRRGIGS